MAEGGAGINRFYPVNPMSEACSTKRTFRISGSAFLACGLMLCGRPIESGLAERPLALIEPVRLVAQNRTSRVRIFRSPVFIFPPYFERAVLTGRSGDGYSSGIIADESGKSLPFMGRCELLGRARTLESVRIAWSGCLMREGRSVEKGRSPAGTGHDGNSGSERSSARLSRKGGPGLPLSSANGVRLKSMRSLLSAAGHPNCRSGDLPRTGHEEEPFFRILSRTMEHSRIRSCVRYGKGSITMDIGKRAHALARSAYAIALAAMLTLGMLPSAALATTPGFEGGGSL